MQKKARCPIDGILAALDSAIPRGQSAMANSPVPASPLTSFRLVIAILAMIAVPAALTLHTVRVSAVIDPSQRDPSPYGYTISLLLFIVPIAVIAFWFVPREGLKISKTAFAWTIGILFPLGAALD